MIRLIPVAAACAGCASTPLPPEHLASAEAAIRGAAEVGAESVPQAALHLKMARDEVAQAKAYERDGDHARAAMVLARAGADAELSLTLTRESTARAEANDLLAQVRALRQERSP